MSNNPWSRPTVHDLRVVLKGIDKFDGTDLRVQERMELTVPAEIVTQRGNSIPAITRELNHLGIGLLHSGSISLEEVAVKIATELQEYSYPVFIEWCVPCENGMFLSGGRFMSQPDS